MTSMALKEICHTKSFQIKFSIQINENQSGFNLTEYIRVQNDSVCFI